MVSDSSARLILAPLALLLSISLAAYLRAHSRRRRLAPGPEGHWFYGNAAQFPPEKPWLWYAKLHEEHGAVQAQRRKDAYEWSPITTGDIVRLTLPGSEMIVLKTLESVQDLFVKRSTIYSDRPRQVMTGEIIGLNIATFLAPYGELWRAQRKLWHQHTGAQAISGYHAMLYRLNLDLMKTLHEGEQDVHDALHQSIVRTMLMVAYGMDVQKDAKGWPETLSTLNNEVQATLTPGKYLVDLIPALKYVPSWLPGTSWKRYGEQLKARSRKIADEPFLHVRQELAAGNASNCVTTQMLETDYPGIAGSEACQKWVTGSIYGAGVDTTQAILRKFVYAMVTNPQMQKRAQEELDGVTEGGRLPTLRDLPSLPYLTAIMQECFRWQTSLPTAVAHRLMEDDEYKGYLLRKGSTVLANIWAIAHDPKEYPDPDIFNPERFMGADPASDPRTFAFGVGRRMCPGRYLGEASVFTTASMLLATSTLKKATDRNGREIEPEFVTVGSFINDVHPFPCQVRLRSPEKAALILAELEAYK